MRNVSQTVTGEHRNETCVQHGKKEKKRHLIEGERSRERERLETDRVDRQTDR